MRTATMQTSRRRFAAQTLAGALPLRASAPGPRVEAEEEVYTFVPADNGAGPLWASGAPGMVRAGDTVFLTGLDTLPGVKPLHNCRWTLYRRARARWERVLADEQGRQREPCPLARWEDGRLFLSTNPTLTAPDTYSGPADPHLLVFSSRDLRRPPARFRPAWPGNPKLVEHTYRGLGVDAREGQLLLLHNNGTGAPEAYWAFLGRDGQWRNQGVLRYPIRGCYPQVALRQGVAHVLAVGDIVEPVAEWRAWKFEASGGRKWDYVFRRLFYALNPDVASGDFGEVIEAANVEETAGHLTNLDLWLDPAGAAHLLYLKRNVATPAFRDRFFPGLALRITLEYATVRDRRIAGVRTLLAGGDQDGSEIPVWGRFHATPDGRLFVIAAVRQDTPGAPPRHENRLLAIAPDGGSAPGQRAELRYPFVNFLTATERGGSRPSSFLDLAGICDGAPATTIRYARIRL